MEFLPSFLRRHFAGKVVVASRNVGCFLDHERGIMKAYRVKRIRKDQVVVLAFDEYREYTKY